MVLLSRGDDGELFSSISSALGGAEPNAIASLRGTSLTLNVLDGMCRQFLDVGGLWWHSKSMAGAQSTITPQAGERSLIQSECRLVQAYRPKSRLP